MYVYTRHIGELYTNVMTVRIHAFWVKYTYIRTYCADTLILDSETQYGRTYLHWQSRVHWERTDL